MHTFRRFSLWLLCLCLWLFSAPLLAHPAMWQIKQGQSTVYLFGTVHLLPNDTDWSSPQLDHALADSKQLYLELVDDDQTAMTALVLRFGMDMNHPLATLLTPAENKQVEAAAELAGLPNGALALQPMKPWMAALTLAVAPLEKAGMDPNAGVDKTLKTRMTAAGKPVLGLETAEQQIHYLADMPQDQQLSFLRETLKDVDKAKQEMTQLIDAWKNGDVAAITKLENDDMRQGDPALYQQLLVQRNQRWAGQIKQLLQTPGTTFIAVGAAHLAGPDSVQVQLGKLGVQTQRVQ